MSENLKSIRQYTIIEELGKGSYGIVYKVSKKDSLEIYVLKQIQLFGLNTDQITEVNREASIMSSLDLPFIVKYYESFTENNYLNIIMEYCDKGDLATFLKNQKIHGKYLKEEKIWNFFIQICSGLSLIHRKNILHRDLKTLNIFLTKDDSVRIGDLGVAKVLNSDGSFANTFVGTPYYLSPEMCEEKPYNEKSDVWALGCIVYELATFNHPFNAKNPAALCLKILTTKPESIPIFYSEDLKKLIELLLEKDYQKRPTASEILRNKFVMEKSKKYNIDLTNSMSTLESVSKKTLLTDRKIDLKSPIQNDKKKVYNQIIQIDLNQNIQDGMKLAAKKTNARMENPIKGIFLNSNYNSNHKSEKDSNLLEIKNKKNKNDEKIDVNNEKHVQVKHTHSKSKNYEIGVSKIKLSHQKSSNEKNIAKILKILGGYEPKKNNNIKLQKNNDKSKIVENYENEAMKLKEKAEDLKMKINSDKKYHTPSTKKITNSYFPQENPKKLITPQIKCNNINQKRLTIEYISFSKQSNSKASINELESNSKDEEKQNSRNIQENNRFFLKKYLTKSELEKLVFVNNSQQVKIESFLKENCLETLNKNLKINSYAEVQNSNSDIFRENSTNLVQSQEISGNCTKNQCSSHDFTQEFFMNVNLGGSNSIKRQESSENEKDIEEIQVIPLSFNVKDEGSNPQNMSFEIQKDDYSDQHKAHDTSSEVEDNEKSLEESINNQTEFNGDDNEIIESINFCKNKDEENLKRINECIEKINKLSDKCRKILGNDKFEKIYDIYKKLCETLDNETDGVEKFETIISKEVPNNVVFFKVFKQLIYYEMIHEKAKNEIKKLYKK